MVSTSHVICSYDHSKALFYKLEGVMKIMLNLLFLLNYKH